VTSDKHPTDSVVAVRTGEVVAGGAVEAGDGAAERSVARERAELVEHDGDEEEEEKATTNRHEWETRNHGHSTPLVVPVPVPVPALFVPVRGGAHARCIVIDMEGKSPSV
jgi:hypothetical protein